MTSTLPSLRVARQRGVTLTELMIALVLGALVVLAATAMVVTSRGTYRSQDEGTRLAESARFGLELSNRLIRLAGYTNFGDDVTPPASYTTDPAWTIAPDAYALNGPNVVGANDSKPVSGTPINHSDSLTIRFFGSSPIDAPVADGNILDCAGFAVPQAQTATAPTSAVSATSVNNAARAYNVLFVDLDTDGEPALKCKRQTYDAAGQPSGSDTQTLIRGVEDFQVLYGELIPQTATPTAPSLGDLDLYAPAAIVYRTGIGGPNPVHDWGNVRAVRIAMLLRSATGVRPEAEPSTAVYQLFGDGYATATAADSGATFSLASLGNADRTRARRIVETTVFIRNRTSDWQSVFVN